MVSPVKGSGIGQVTFPSNAELEALARRRVESSVPSFSDIAGEYTKAYLEGTGSRAEMFPPVVPDYSSQADTIGGQILGHGAEGILNLLRTAVSAPIYYGGIAGDYLESPSKKGKDKMVASELARIQSEIDPFRQAVARPKDLSASIAALLATQDADMPGEPDKLGAGELEALADSDMTIQEEIDRLSKNLSTNTFMAGDETRPVTDAERPTVDITGPTPRPDVPEEKALSTGTFNIGDEGRPVTSTEGGEKEDPKTAFESIIADQMKAVDEAAGESTEGKTAQDYMKEFQEATGVNISGKPDKSHALMAFGLSLMQNKAGKGFNVSKALSALGEAGEEAMPAFQKAKEQARTERLAAGKYGLQQVAQDKANKAAALAKEQEFLNELIKSEADSVEAMRLEELKQKNAIQLEKVKGEIALLSEEPENLYLEKTSSTPLFKDAPDVFKMETFTENPNLGQSPPLKLTTASYNNLQSNLPSYEAALNRTEAELASIQAIVADNNITRQQQIGSMMKSFVRGFGYKTDAALDEVAQARILLDKIRTENTAEILGEAGKTISDIDRALVKDIVGDINLKDADPAVLMQKLNQVYTLIVEKGRANLDTAYGTLYSAGYDDLVPQGYIQSVQSATSAGDDLNAEEAAELQSLRGK